jgi:dienelactone hydrolase
MQAPRPIWLATFALTTIITARAVGAPAATPKPVPPPGITISEADRTFFETTLSALAEQVRKLRARADLAPALPDVEIYYRAVDTALRAGEFFAPEDVTRAKALLSTGKARADALAQGKTPWLEQTGPIALGYVSRIDGSVQPYGVTLPASFSARSAQRWRLDAWFHGRNEDLSEVNFIAGVTKSPGEFASEKAILLSPYGRYCNGSKFAGEVDFFEALADVERRFPIDEDRIVIRGFSLGGHSAWHLGAHHAWRWAAVAPGAGFSESREFLTMFEKDKLLYTPVEATLWQLYDAPPYAENLRNVPLVAYSGENDRQKQAADLMAGVLQKVGLEMTHLIGPGTKHQYHPQSKATLNQLIDAIAARGRDPMPRRISLATPTLKYNRQGWIQVDGLGQHWTRATVEGELRGDNEIDLRTKNVTGVSVIMPPGRAPFFGGRAPTVVLDGQRLSGPLPASDRSYSAHFHKAQGRWAPGVIADDGGLRKRHDLQGPIDDAFMDSFLMVTPEGKPLSADVGAWVLAEQTRAVKEWRRQFRGDARARQDVAVTDAEIAEHNLILWGDPSSNKVLGRLADKLPISWTAAGIKVGKRSFAADKHALIAIYPNPLNPRRYVVLNSGFTFRDYDALNNARQTPKLADWAVVDTSVTADPAAPMAERYRLPGKVVAEDFFDERWQLRPAKP